MNVLQQYWLGLLVIILIGFGVIVSYNHRGNEFKVHHNTNSTPNEIVNHAHYQQYNVKGILIDDLHSPFAIHFLKNNETFFTKPKLHYINKAGVPWYIQALHGKSLHKASRVYLWGKVRIKESATKQSPWTLITTSKMTIYPHKQIAITHQPVVITRPDSIVHAIGMHANLKTGVIKLLSQAKGSYVSQSSN